MIGRIFNTMCVVAALGVAVLWAVSYARPLRVEPDHNASRWVQVNVERGAVTFCYHSSHAPPAPATATSNLAIRFREVRVQYLNTRHTLERGYRWTIAGIERNAAAQRWLGEDVSVDYVAKETASARRLHQAGLRVARKKASAAMLSVLDAKAFHISFWRTPTPNGILRFPVWCVVALLFVFPIRSILRGPWMRHLRRRRGRCTTCGYDLTGNVSGVCPECGLALVGRSAV